MNINGVLHKFAKRPKTLFLVDGIGAGISMLLLGLVLPAIHEKIGLTKEHLYFLATFAAVFLLIDMYRFMAATDKWKRRVRIIISLNLLYCVISAIVVAISHDTITKLGLLYFIGEIFIILILVRFERSVYKRLD